MERKPRGTTCRIDGPTATEYPVPGRNRSMKTVLPSPGTPYGPMSNHPRRYHFSPKGCRKVTWWTLPQVQVDLAFPNLSRRKDMASRSDRAATSSSVSFRPDVMFSRIGESPRSITRSIAFHARIDVRENSSYRGGPIASRNTFSISFSKYTS